MKNNRKIKIVLLSVIILSLCALAAVFTGYRRMLDKTETAMSDIKEGTSMSIQTVRQTASKNGITEWSLDAESVSFMNKEKQAVFLKPSVTFFLKDQSEASLTAAQGIVNTDSNDIKMKGRVIMKNQEYLLKTQTLNYLHELKRFSSDSPVEINGSDFEISADSASFYLDSKKIMFKGNVRGSFAKGLNL